MSVVIVGGNDKMIVTATQTAGKNNIEIARSHSSSATALKKILSQYCGC